MEVLELINALRASDEYIKLIFTEGSCYKFSMFLKKLYPVSIPYINKKRTHVITRIGGRFYNITGEVSEEERTGQGFRLMDKLEKSVASGWSFRKNNFLKVGECHKCEEPLII